jgi:hypothetical protein
MTVPSQFALKTQTNFGAAASLATLDKLVDRFPLPPVAPPIGDTSLTHVMRLATRSTTSPKPTAMGESFLMTLYKQSCEQNLKFLFIIICLSTRVNLNRFYKYVSPLCTSFLIKPYFLFTSTFNM